MDIFGICIKPLRKDEVFTSITFLDSQKILFTPNPEILLGAKNDPVFRSLLQKADILTSDGIGLYIAYQILDSKLPFFLTILLLPYYFFNLFFRRASLYEKYGERITGNDLTKDLLIWCEKQGITIMVSDFYNPLDTLKVQAQRVFIEKMKSAYPLLVIDYFIWNLEEKEKILSQMKLSQASILFSTLGMKKQEENVIEIMQLCPEIKLGL
jgi:N-acetylglucosaminyldiphosphoundecaprenol N-acetyl-beta-D-mannosaminyltransferase